MPQRKGGGKRDSLSRGPDQWGMGKERKKATYKYLWIKGNELPLLTFLKIMKMKTSHFQIVNLTTLLHLLKMEGSRKRETDRFDPGNLALQLLQST